MTNSQAGRTSRSSKSRVEPKPAAPVATRHDTADLRDLLEANLYALRSLHEEHHRMLQTSLRTIDGVCSELRSELLAIGSARAPWVRAMSETRALLFIALRELIVGEHEAEIALALGHEPPHAR